MRSLFLILLSLFVAAPASASAYRDFVNVWDAREQTYRSERPALDSNAQSSAARAVQSLVTGDPGAADDLSLALTAAWSLSELVGRGQTLFQLREHMATKPSVALSEAWLQGKLDEVRRRETDADLVERQLEMLRDRDTQSVQQWIAALERLSMMRGNIAGTAGELELIRQNLSSYYRAQKSEPSGLAVDLWEKLFGALARNAADKQENVQAWSAACARTGKCERR